MRVHELAKAVQLESKEVIAIAKKHRVQIKPSPSANVEDKDIRKMMPFIEKYKTEQQAQALEEKKKKEEERQQKEEERRRKEEERRRDIEAKRVAEANARKKAEEEARLKDRQKRATERKASEDATRMQREEETRRRQEDERLRSLGIPVPKRPANFRPRIQPSPEVGVDPRPRQGDRPRTPGGPHQQQRQPRPGDRPHPGRPQGGGEFRPRPGVGQQRPGGGQQQRPGGGQQRPGGGGPPRAGGQQPEVAADEVAGGLAELLLQYALAAFDQAAQGALFAFPPFLLQVALGIADPDIEVFPAGAAEDDDGISAADDADFVGGSGADAVRVEDGRQLHR